MNSTTETCSLSVSNKSNVVHWHWTKNSFNASILFPQSEDFWYVLKMFPYTHGTTTALCATSTKDGGLEANAYNNPWTVSRRAKRILPAGSAASNSPYWCQEESFIPVMQANGLPYYINRTSPCLTTAVNISVPPPTVGSQIWSPTSCFDTSASSGYPLFVSTGWERWTQNEAKSFGTLNIDTLSTSQPTTFAPTSPTNVRTGTYSSKLYSQPGCNNESALLRTETMESNRCVAFSETMSVKSWVLLNTTNVTGWRIVYTGSRTCEGKQQLSSVRFGRCSYDPGKYGYMFYAISADVGNWPIQSGVAAYPRGRGWVTRATFQTPPGPGGCDANGTTPESVIGYAADACIQEKPDRWETWRTTVSSNGERTVQKLVCYSPDCSECELLNVYDLSNETTACFAESASLSVRVSYIADPGAPIGSYQIATRGPSPAPTLSPTSRSPATSSPVFRLQPTAIRAWFVNSVTKIRVQFNRPTTAPNNIACSDYFVATTVGSFGSGATCAWTLPHILTITLSPGFTAAPMDVLTILGGAVVGLASAVVGASPEHAVVLEAPSNPPVVSVSLAGGSTVGSCDLSTQLTAVAAGGAGRPLVYAWGYQSSTNSAETALFRAWMQLRVSVATSSSLTVPAANLTVGHQYSFNVTATNWLGTAASANFTIAKIGGEVPQLILSGPLQVSVRHAQPLSIRVQVNPYTCASNGAVLRARGVWSQVSNGAPAVPIGNPASVFLSLTSGALSYGYNYAFQLTAVSLDLAGQTVGSANATFAVTVELEAVVAAIAGGSTRLVPVVPSMPRMLVFDAAGSLDPTYPSSSLLYDWQVVDTTSNATIALTAATATNGTKLLLNTSALVGGNSYLVEVTVNSTSGPSRVARASQFLNTVALAIPIVNISGADAKHNPGNALRLKATTRDARSVTYAWECKSLNFNLSDRASLRSSTTSPQLVIKPGVLTPGQIYTFRASAVTPAGLTGYASAVVVVNTKPTLGTCSVSPSRGVALETSFTLSCAGWTDDDAPLRYQFQTTSGARVGGTGVYIDLCAPQLIESYQTQLPASEGANGTEIRAVVFDNLGAFATISMQVNVTQKPSINLGAAVDNLNDKLVEGDTQAYGVLCLGVSAYLRSKSANSSRGSASGPSSSTGGALNATQIAETRLDLLQSLKSISLTSNATIGATAGEPADVELVAVLVDAVTNYVEPEEITRSSQTIAIALLEQVTASAKDASTNTAAATASAAANLVSASIASNATGDAGFSANASLRLTGVLSSLSVKQIASAVVDEDPVVTVSPNSTGRARVVVASQRVSNVSGRSLQDKDAGTAVTFPPLPDLDGSGELEIALIGVRGDTVFPSDRAEGQGRDGGLSIVEIKVGGVTQTVRASQTPFRLSIPPGRVDEQSVGAVPDRTVCRYWNETTNAWATNGVAYVSGSADVGTQCDSYHLTAFNSRTTFKIEINTVSGDDLVIEAFDPAKNEIMAMMIALYCAFLAAFPFAWASDRKAALADQDGAQEASFWRTQNSMREARVAGRSRQHFRKLAVWGIRRRHPWLSVCMHPRGDFMTARKRLLILFVLLINVTAVCALLVGTKQDLPFISGSLSRALFACILSFPVPYMFGLFFSRRVPKKYRLSTNRKLIGGAFIGYLLFLVAMCSQGSGVDFEAEADDDNDAEGGQDASGDAREEDDYDAGGDAREEDDYDAVGGEVPSEEDGEADAVRNAYDEKDGKSNAAQRSSLANEDYEASEKANDKRGDDRVVAGAAVGAAAGVAVAEPRTDRKSTRRRYEKADEKLPMLRGSGAGARHSRVRGAADRKERKTNGRRDDFCWSHAPLGCLVDKKTGSAVGARSDGLRTYDIVPMDVVGIAFSLLFALGASLLLIILAWRLRETAGDAMVSSLLSFAQDLVLRCVTIVSIEYMLVAPLCSVCCFLCGKSGEPGESSYRSAGYHELVLSSDQDAFSLNDRGVVSSVTERGRGFGIKIGWRLVGVNGHSVRSGPDCAQALHRAHRLSSQFKVVFSDNRHRSGRPMTEAEAKAYARLRASSASATSIASRNTQRRIEAKLERSILRGSRASRRQSRRNGGSQSNARRVTATSLSQSRSSRRGTSEIELRNVSASRILGASGASHARRDLGDTVVV